MAAENLMLDADSFDAVICRIALHHFPKALTEMRRVVTPGGKVAVIVFSALEKNPYYGIVFGTVQRLGNMRSSAARQPRMCALGDPGKLEDLYRRAGFLNVSVQALSVQQRFPSMAEAIRTMRNSAGYLREAHQRIQRG